jgi:cytochrome c
MEWNKLAAAFLVAGIAYGGMGVIADNLSHPQRLDHSVLKIAGVAAETPATTAPAQKALAPIAPLLVSASVPAGEADAKKLCSACHNFTEGGGAKIGPDLYGVLGRERASAPGFDYSSALKGKKGDWTYETLNEWLDSPKTFAPGTKMSFAGIDDGKERADVIDYLRSLSHNPEPLPAPGTAKAESTEAKGAAATPPAKTEANTPVSAKSDAGGAPAKPDTSAAPAKPDTGATPPKPASSPTPAPKTGAAATPEKADTGASPATDDASSDKAGNDKE